MGPILGRQHPGGPHVGPANLAIWGKHKVTSEQGDLIKSYFEKKCLSSCLRVYVVSNAGPVMVKSDLPVGPVNMKSNGNIFSVPGPLWGESTVDYPHKGQWRGALMFSFICTWTNGGANNRDAGYSRHHRAHYDVTVLQFLTQNCQLDWIKIEYFHSFKKNDKIGLSRSVAITYP